MYEKTIRPIVVTLIKAARKASRRALSYNRDAAAKNGIAKEWCARAAVEARQEAKHLILAAKALKHNYPYNKLGE